MSAEADYRTVVEGMVILETSWSGACTNFGERFASFMEIWNDADRKAIIVAMLNETETSFTERKARLLKFKAAHEAVIAMFPEFEHTTPEA